MGEVEEWVLMLKGIGGPWCEGTAQQEGCEGMGGGVVLGEGGKGGESVVDWGEVKRGRWLLCYHIRLAGFTSFRMVDFFTGGLEGGRQCQHQLRCLFRHSSHRFNYPNTVQTMHRQR